MELISRIMDGSIPYDPEGRLEPVSAGLGVKQDDKIERLKEVPLFEACSQRQLRSVAKIARVFDVAALAAEAPRRRLLVRAPPKSGSIPRSPARSRRWRSLTKLDNWLSHLVDRLVWYRSTNYLGGDNDAICQARFGSTDVDVTRCSCGRPGGRGECGDRPLVGDIYLQ